MATVSDAVHFALEDYASPPRRLFSFGIDLVVIVLFFIVLGIGAEFAVVPRHIWTMSPSAEKLKMTRQYIKPVQVPLTLGWLGAVVAYHVLARTTRGGTVGYRLTGIRLIDKTGRTPSTKTAFKRFLIAMPSCMTLGAGYVLCFKTPRRQAIHDRWSGTWLVRRRAEPIGPALSTYHTKLFGTFILTYTDVEPAPAA
jgi:uncharacterized RDD family membrane protein YckC